MSACRLRPATSSIRMCKKKKTCSPPVGAKNKKQASLGKKNTASCRSYLPYAQNKFIARQRSTCHENAPPSPPPTSIPAAGKHVVSDLPYLAVILALISPAPQGHTCLCVLGAAPQTSRVLAGNHHGASPPISSHGGVAQEGRDIEAHLLSRLYIFCSHQEGGLAYDAGPALHSCPTSNCPSMPSSPHPIA
jgi:hypothetical protein